MSRAFIKEDGPDNTPLPDLPIPPQPNHVTPEGLARLRARLLASQDLLTNLRARPDRLDRLPEAAAERDIRYLEARLRTAILVDPATHPPGEAGFGSTVTVRAEDGTEHRYRITGEDEADAAEGRVTPYSPLGRALMGARIGDTVTWAKPGRPMELEIAAVHHGPPA
jgi:transcription elongation factor GreB